MEIVYVEKTNIFKSTDILTKIEQTMFVEFSLCENISKDGQESTINSPPLAAKNNDNNKKTLKKSKRTLRANRFNLRIFNQ